MEFGIEPGVEKIAVFRPNGLGDLMFALPALDALRHAYPSAEIVLLALPWHVQFFDDRPSPVDRVLAIPRLRGIYEDADHPENPSQAAEFLAAMRAECFDIAIQLYGGGAYSNPLVKRFDARLTVGLRDRGAEPLDRWVPYVYYQKEVFRYLEVVALIGAPPTTFEPEVTVTAADLTESRGVAPESDRPLAVLHPGAGDPRRRWPPEKFAAVGDALVAAGARVVVTGTEDECRLCAAVQGAMRSPALNACGRLSLGGLVGLLARAAVVVSNDSGPLHLAHAVGAATVGIYWCGNVINAAPVTRARHRPILSWRLDCPVCGTDCTRAACAHRASFVADVPVAEVTDAALELLAGTGVRMRTAGHRAGAADGRAIPGAIAAPRTGVSPGDQ